MENRGKAIKHGMARRSGYSQFYNKYYDMRTRCDNPNFKQYSDYGGRGITYEWRTFMDFKEAMYESYLEHRKTHSKANTTLDRINVDEDYTTENCRWATKVQQARNTRMNKMLTYKDETKCVAEWEESLGVKSGRIKHRLYRGWSIEKAIETPVDKSSGHKK